MLKAPGTHRQALKRCRKDEGVGDEGAKVTKILAMTLDQAPLRIPQGKEGDLGPRALYVCRRPPTPDHGAFASEPCRGGPSSR